MKYKHHLESSRFQLMDQAVQPLTRQPLYHSALESFTHIALDSVHTKTETVHVLFVATRNNLIKKLSVKLSLEEGGSAQTCVVEMWQSDVGAAANILSMEFLKETDSLYVGMDHALTRIPAQHCSRHVSKSSCLNAMDPYCGWNSLIERCTSWELGLSHQMSKQFWIQADNLKCPILTAPIDGAWSSWSEWYSCKKNSLSEDGGLQDDGQCQCRLRECNNPRPQNGGKECEGITTEVQNCTVHGGWTDWSAWSSCSQTCGIAVKTRRRTCGNPKPAFGGRMCVGVDRQEMYCSNLPPCPAPKAAAVDGGWGPWGEWSECSAPCNGGFRIRRRECNDPAPKNEGLDCIGCNTDFEVCNTHKCEEVERLSPWSPWIPYNKSNSELQKEHRFRYACRANIGDPYAHNFRIQLAREQTRICRPDGTCHRASGADEELSEHIEWGPCNVTCGGGIQYASHEGKHRGHHAKSRACNTHACPLNINEVVSSHEWSCWTEWTPCSVSCGVGLRRRTRRCLGGHEKLCNGRAIEEEKCEMTPCEGKKCFEIVFSI